MADITSAMNATQQVFCRGDLSERVKLSFNEQLTIAVIFSLIIPFIVTTNSTTIYLLVKLQQMTVITNYFIASLCCSDLTIGLLVCPLWITIFTKFSSENNCLIEAITVFPAIALGHFSLYMITFVAIERYLRITYPLQPNIITRQSAFKLIIGAAMIAITCGVITTTSFWYGYLVMANFILVSLASIMFLAIVLIYLKAMRSLMKRRRTVGCVSGPSRTSPEMVFSSAMTTTWIVLSLSICYMPCFVFTLINFFYSQKGNNHSSGRYMIFSTLVSYPFFYLNSGINAAIILFRNRFLKRYITQRLSALFNGTPTTNQVATQMIPTFKGTAG